MKKLFLFTLVSLMAVSAMAIGDNDGKTQPNAYEFNWSRGDTITTLNEWVWYRVDLAPLYEEDNPSLTLYMTNPSSVVGSSARVSMEAYVMGQTKTETHTIYAHQYKTYTANAVALVRAKQKEIYLKIKTTDVIRLSARVFETEDLDETCKDGARLLKWDTPTVQEPRYSTWWKVDLKPIKSETAASAYDAKVTITNTGSKAVHVKATQSLDCPSSGTTRRDFDLAPGESVIDTVPRSMINSVQPDELYFGIENVESQVTLLVEKVAQPADPIIKLTDKFIPMHVETDTILHMFADTLYRFDVAEMRDTMKYEPEFTYLNVGTTPAKVIVKMAFEVPAYGTSNSVYEIAPGEEAVVVYKKNMLDGLGDDMEYIYLKTIVEGDVQFTSRFKHVRESKACKTSIDYDWLNGHTQEERTTQWYAVRIADARDNQCDIMLYMQNLSSSSVKLNAKLAFSCPFIDVQEVSHTLAPKAAAYSRRIGYSSYAMMSDTVWVGLTTDQNIRFWADTIPAKTKTPDIICEQADTLNWKDGIQVDKDTTMWFVVDVAEGQKQAAKFPTVFIQNMSNTAAAKITAELSLECPDSIENEKRTLTIAANGSYSRQVSSNMFKNISQKYVYLKVRSTQPIKLQILLTEKPAGSDCESAIPFNWVSGNIQDANANLWYIVDLHDVMKQGNDLKLHILNRDNTQCKGVVQLAYSCPMEDAPSIQDFKLAANAEKKITLQNSALDAVNDSVVYVNLQGTTSLRIWADTLEVAKFDTIYPAGLTFDTIYWDSLYTQTKDTVWYIIPKSEILKVRNLDDKLTPVVHAINLATTENTIKGEAAFAFPIGKKMMTKSLKLRGGQHYKDTVPVGTFEQFTKKDSIILRITRKKGAGNFQFKAELVKAFSGNSRYQAIPILMDQQYTQAPNTEMWYKIKSADWKKDKSLFGKSLHVMGKNAGKGDAKVTVAVYEGLMSEEDLIEYYTGKKGSRTIKKGQSKSHNIPAQAVYGVGDVEFYVKVRTTDSLVFESSFSNYSALTTVDTMQHHAKLVVPNVDYILPKDSVRWFQVCVPYIRNNFKYVDSAFVAYDLDGPAKITVTATFQDTLSYNVPVRTRTINKSGKARHGEKSLKELLNKAIEKAGQSIDISGFKEEFIDSMLHRYVTKDSVTLYFRVQSDRQIKLRLNTPQVKGDSCLAPMEFDWEHGNVNSAMRTTWIHVGLDSTRVPVGKDLLLHMDNWSEGPTNVKAVIEEEDCSHKELGSVSRLITNDTIKVLQRKLLQTWGWSGLMMKYYSDSATHIWAETIDQVIPDTLRDTIQMFVCPKYKFIDKSDTLRTINSDTTWTAVYDSINKSEVKFYICETLYEVALLKDTVFKIDSLKTMPVIAKSAVLDMTAPTNELLNMYIAAVAADSTLKSVSGTDSIAWEYTDGAAWKAIPTTALDTTVIALRYIVLTECGNRDTSDVWVNIPNFNIDTTACDKFIWDRMPGKVYTASCKDTALVNVKLLDDGVTVLQKRECLDLTILHATTSDTTATACDSIVWHGKIYKTSGNYNDTLTNAIGCDSIITLHLTIGAQSTSDTTATECKSFTWHGKTYTTSGNYKDTLTNAAGCDSIVTLHLTINMPTTGDTTATACTAFKWHGKTYDKSGNYVDTLVNAAKCDSILTLHLTITRIPGAVTTDKTCTSALPYIWQGNKYTKSGTYTDTVSTLAGCDSILTLNLTVASAFNDTLPKETACNFVKYKWGDDSVKTYNKTGFYTRTFVTLDGCDSLVTLPVEVTDSARFELDAVAKYGNRLLMINRLSIQDKTGWDLDSLGANGEATEVVWWMVENASDKVSKKVGTGYYLVNEKNPGEPLKGIYWAVITLPGTGNTCGQLGYTKRIDCTGAVAAAPALMPSLARPGEAIRVVNLDPDKETTIRIYTTEGLIRETYTVSGEETFVITAAMDHGFYLVELKNEDLQSTLRYIVK